MAAELKFDVAEKIFIGFDVKELTRFKCVCKSWQSFISNPCFVNAHLKHTYNFNVRNSNIGDPRIVIPFEDKYSSFHTLSMVGSSNGLVCISPVDAKLVITNPLTKELIKLPKLMSGSKLSRDSLCWGFGYDSSVDDYKIILGLMKNDAPTRFVMLALKTNTWKHIGVVNYRNIGRRSAVSCNGALHWFMKTTNREKNENVILSFDLILNEFKEIPQPDDDNVLLVYKSETDHKTLGSINECLCICDGQQPYHMWLMKNHNVKESWERFPWDEGEFRPTSYRFLHEVKLVGGIVSYKITSTFLWDYVCDPIFVQSLVSPHLYYNGRPRKAFKVPKNKNNKLMVKVQIFTQTLKKMLERYETQQREIDEMKKREEKRKKELEDLKVKSEAETKEMKATIAAMMKFLPGVTPTKPCMIL